ncbi:MAG: fused MFS/spermidine synthase [Verrucomicrobia bacterium]|nr:fused MFS/spermidine synthase [Verrucomicrobiota bacterium]
MPAFALAIFTGAFLIFLVQPLIAKFILPWFGGTPAVWSTCVLFFQLLLLGGYAYAHLSISKLTPRRQVILHLALLAVALLWLPIVPGEQWKPADGTNPSGRILLLLLATLGLPYLVLSATGPLMQAWFAEARPGVSPYRLYALSNVGSLLALVAYPFIVEPNLSRRAQAWAWSGGLLLFIGFAVWCGVLVWKAAGQTKPASTPEMAAADSAAEDKGGPKWLWFMLPACASVLLLAVTNKICQDIAVIPFLWVVPLSLYLVTFIVSFDGPRWYWRPFWIPLFVISIGALLWMLAGPDLTEPTSKTLKPLAWLIEKSNGLSILTIIGIYVGTMFVCCMVCHGELYRLRPGAKKLTGYFLTISAGGAAGGLFVALVAPFIFRHFLEMQVGFFAVCVLVVTVLWVDKNGWLRHPRHAWSWFVVLPALGGVGGLFYFDAREDMRGASELARNFYGVLKVYESWPDNPDLHKFMFQHGGTTHGLQFVDDAKRRLPTTYYTSSSGVGLAMKNFPRKENRRIGLVGLGAGSLAVYGKAGDTMRIYEINPEVPRIANKWFTYLKDSAAKIELSMGDARLSLEREPSQQFDILVLDAFSSDAIPVHLLTREAIEIYRRHLKPDGVICVHISNRHLNLQPVVFDLARHFNYKAILFRDDDVDERQEDEETGGAYTTDWVLLTNNEEFANLPAIHGGKGERDEFKKKMPMWTDERSSLSEIFIF